MVTVGRATLRTGGTCLLRGWRRAAHANQDATFLMGLMGEEVLDDLGLDYSEGGEPEVTARCSFHRHHFSEASLFMSRSIGDMMNKL